MSRTDRYFKDGRKVMYLRDFYDDLWDLHGYGYRYNSRKRYRRTPVKWKQKQIYYAKQGCEICCNTDFN